MARKKKAETESNGVALLEPPSTPESLLEPETVVQADDEKPGITIVQDPVTGVFEKAQATYFAEQVAPLAQAMSDEALEAIEWRKKVRAKGQEVATLKSELTYKAEEHKEAKKAWESASTELQMLVCREPKALPLIDGAKARAAEASNQAPPPSPAPDESWRADSIAILKLSPGLQASLDDAGLATLGKIADWTAKGNNLTDIKGIGEKAAEKIQDALEAYWRDHGPTPAPHGPPVAMGGGSEAEDDDVIDPDFNVVDDDEEGDDDEAGVDYPDDEADSASDEDESE